MKLFDKRTAKAAANKSAANRHAMNNGKEIIQNLSAAETTVVTGGLNPQPLPPGYISIAVLPRS